MAWNLLLTSDIGLLSLFTIAFMVLMAAYMFRYAMRHASEERAQHAATSKDAPRAR